MTEKVYELRKQIADKEQEIAEKCDILNGFSEILETRDLNPDEEIEFGNVKNDVEGLKSDVKGLHGRVTKLESVPTYDATEVNGPARKSDLSYMTRDRSDFGNYLATREYEDAFYEHLRTGYAIRTNAASFLANTNTAGGYAIAPVQLNKKIITNINLLLPVRNKITKIQVNDALALRVPRLDTDPAQPQFGGEGTQLSPDLTAAFATQDLTPYLASTLLTVSMTMMAMGNQSIENLIVDRLSYLFALEEETQILTGNGTGSNFVGAFTASANGIPTSQDVQTATAATLAGDDILNVYASLNPAVLQSPNCAWVMHMSTYIAVRKLKDSMGRSLLEPSLAAGNPGTIMGIPVLVSNVAPAYSTTSGSYVAVLGDWSYYYESYYNNEFNLQRLNERYADSSLVGIVGRRWYNGAPIKAQAFARLKIQ